MNVAVIGASDKKNRYSYMAFSLLKEKGHQAFPVHRRVKEIEGNPVYSSIAEIKEPVDTVTLYVGANISTLMGDDILAMKPKRVIFNPGAENPDLEARLKEAGIKPVNSCTIVMLKTGQF